MRIGGSGSADINLLQSDAGQFRNEDFQVNQEQCFWGQSLQAAVSARFANVQLWNPAASGFIIIVDVIEVTMLTAAAIRTYFTTTELDEATGAWRSKKLGASTGVGLINRQDQVATGSNIINRVNVLASSPHVLEFKYPIILAEESGLNIECETANIAIIANFEGREIAV